LLFGGCRGHARWVARNAGALVHHARDADLNCASSGKMALNIT
jgi:hypothetical protein